MKKSVFDAVLVDLKSEYKEHIQGLPRTLLARQYRLAIRALKILDRAGVVDSGSKDAARIDYLSDITIAALLEKARRGK